MENPRVSSSLEGGSSSWPPDHPPLSFAAIVGRQGSVAGSHQAIIPIKQPATYKGESALFFSEDETKLLAAPHRLTLVAKCSYGHPSLDVIKIFMRKSTGVRLAFSVGILDSHHLLFRFFKWTPSFVSGVEPSIVLIWASFPNLHLHLFNDSAIRSIGSIIGCKVHSRDGAAEDLFPPKPEKNSGLLDSSNNIGDFDNQSHSKGMEFNVQIEDSDEEWISSDSTSGAVAVVARDHMGSLLSFKADYFPLFIAYYGRGQGPVYGCTLTPGLRIAINRNQNRLAHWVATTTLRRSRDLQDVAPLSLACYHLSGTPSSFLPSPAHRDSWYSAQSGSLDEVFPNGPILPTSNLKIFSFAELKKATRNFSPDMVIGEGGFGAVFKGWLDEKTYEPSRIGTGIVIAVKKLHSESRQGLREWQVNQFN
ncbi:hypothetical protein HHK36_030821 [Tetracentron sinense]|uniref:DUF4283 domain-containing protein n=1 Tax=Tetracentron sinense TaxID=13715 RepID=A0A834YAI3_TETSI|nr:hypothetical protein HHK36_030821 [Tetracentron sinense]